MTQTALSLDECVHAAFKRCGITVEQIKAVVFHPEGNGLRLTGVPNTNALFAELINLANSQGRQYNSQPRTGEFTFH